MATFQIKADTADNATSTTSATTATRATTTAQQIYQQQTNLKQRARRSCGLVAADRLQLQQDTLSYHNNRQRRCGLQSTFDPPPPPPAAAAHPKPKYSATRSTTSKSSRVGQRKRQPFVAAGVTPLRLASNYILRIDSVFIMITMLVVVAVVISGNAVFAAQRDSFKPKDPNSLSNNLNTIPNGIASSSNGNGNVNNASKVNTNTSSSAAATSTVSATGSSSSSSSSASSITTSSTTTTTTSTSSSNSGSSIVSSSLHKVSSSSGMNRNAIEVVEDNRNGPYFDKGASKNITALLGKTAYLNCRVKNLGNKTMLLQVSWVRHRDIHLLTVGRYTYTSDQRFRAIHQPQTEDWILQIKYPQHRDSGVYECQVSTTPHMSHYIHLNVVEPSTEIIGAPDLYIESGSTINLTCVILNSPEPPAYIFWNHNNAIINYDSPRGGVSVVTNKGDTTTSFLLIKSARPSDSGHYQCNPSNAKSKSVTVHVLNGEFPAAMQRAGPALHRMSQSHYLLVYLSIYLFTLASVKRFIRLPQQFVATAVGEQRIIASGC